MKKIVYIAACSMMAFTLCACQKTKALPEYVLEGEVSHNQSGGMEVKDNPNEPFTLDENFISDNIDEQKMNENISETINGVESVKQSETAVRENAEAAYVEADNKYEDVDVNAKAELEKSLIEANQNMQIILEQKQSEMNVSE